MDPSMEQQQETEVAADSPSSVPTNRKRKYDDAQQPSPPDDDVPQPSSPPPHLSSNITFLGNVESERLCIVSPPSTADGDDDPNDLRSTSYILKGLEQIEKILRLRKTQVYLWKAAADSEIKDCRAIQGGRYELFVQSTKLDSLSVWIKILKIGGMKCAYQFTRSLTKYAKARAREDHRVGHDTSTRKWTFDNFSMIVNYTRVREQDAHLDLLYPNFQFGMMLSDGSPGTVYYETPQGQRISNGKQLADLWTKLDPYIPRQLAALLEKDPDVNNKLDLFGAVLGISDPSVPSSSDGNPSQSQSFELPFIKHAMKHVSRGTVLSLPGSQVHAGPSTTNAFRAIMFFSAHPHSKLKEDNELIEDDKAKKRNSFLSEGYDPDTQYNSVVLTAAILQVLWRQYRVAETTRIYLMKRLRMYMELARSFGSGRQQNTPRWHCHFPEQVELTAMLKEMETRVIEEEKMVKQKKEKLPKSLNIPWDVFYEQHARDDYMSALHVESEENVGEFKLVSVPDLFLDYNGSYLLASVFRREVDGNVLIYYSHTNEWEGSMVDDHYRIEWHKSVGERADSFVFDGSNGTLFDSDNNKIAAKAIPTT
ncbi:MAG: hypothetical protein SGILL_001511 [Bacillariaceae sp.]